MTIAQSAEQFVGKLNKLATFSLNVEDKKSRIFKSLENFKDKSSTFSVEVQKKRNTDDGINEIMCHTLKCFENAFASWNERINKDLKGTEFMHKHKKYLVVMVFGAVKAGKSTLGNFFAGQQFLKAPFDNVYKKIPHPKFETEDSGRNSGGVYKDNDGLEWFCEGVTDTTGAIQYFTLSGLRWMDSPGMGALSRQGDSSNMDVLVNEYLPYADFCIFLMNSSEPGLQEDMKYIAKLSRDEQEALVIITRSDETDEVVDENDNIIQSWKAKDAERRKQQEDYICKEIKGKYPDVDEKKYRALSISTRLAEMAVESNNEQLYRDSNIPTLMNILGEKVSNEGILLKERKPKQNVNNFIKAIVDGDDNAYGIKQLEQELAEILKPIRAYKNTIENNTGKISKIVCSNVKNSLQDKARSWSREVERSGKSLSGEELSKRIYDVVVPLLNEKLTKEMADIIKGYQQKRVFSLETKPVGEISKQFKNIKYEYIEQCVRKREADGIWENIKAFFGKTYYELCTKKKTATSSVYTGTNINEWLDKVIPQIEVDVKRSIQAELEYLQKTYFQPQEEYVKKMQQELENLRKELEGLKFS